MFVVALPAAARAQSRGQSTFVAQSRDNGTEAQILALIKFWSFGGCDDWLIPCL
jgi:hypothetical protein